MDPIKTITHKNHQIEIHHDMHPESPRDWDNITEFHCCHKRYTLGDKEFNYQTGEDCIDVANEARKNGDIVLPLYIYDHSGITISLYPFSCPWDSGQVGFVIVRREKMLREFGGKKFSKALKDKALKLAEGEVETYDKYLRGEVYGYVVNDYKDSCWGFYSIEECIEEAKQMVDWIVKQETKNHCVKVKQWIIHKVPLHHRTALC